MELHCKKGSLRLTELRPWRHLCSGITILGKRIQHRAWKTTKQFGKNSSHVLAHLLVVREGLGVLLVFPRVSYGFLTANSNICHGQFWQKEVFFETPCTWTVHYECVHQQILIMWRPFTCIDFDFHIKVSLSLIDSRFLNSLAWEKKITKII